MRGFIYILSNPSLPGLLKIGKTSKDPKTRGDELYATGTPEPFKLEYMAFSDDMDSLERMVHKKLDSYRPNKDREFFKVSRLAAINTIQKESKNFGELKFEEKNFKSADDFWEMAKLLHTKNKENQKKLEGEQDPVWRSIYSTKEFVAVQKPSAKKHVIIFPPQTRAISAENEENEWDNFDDETIWIIDVNAMLDGKRQRIRFTEKQFEEEIENNFVKAFPNNAKGPWVLGYASDYLTFHPFLDDEMYYSSLEDEIISQKVLRDRQLSKTTKYDLKVKREEEEKQRILREKDFKKKETQKMVESKRRNERILSWIFWFIIFSCLSLWLAPGGF